MHAESAETGLSAAPERAGRPGVLRPLAIAVQLAAGLTVAGLVFPLASRPTRLALRQRWASRMLRAIGIDMRVEGAALAPGALFLANHVSWLDVLVLAAHTPATFVAKSEVRCWPAIGWLAERVETVFLRRASGRSLLQVKNRLAGLLRAGQGVALFPEATTSDGRGLLPFRSGLVQAAVDADRLVQPIAIAYDDEEGRPSASAAFIDGMTLWKSVFSICGVGPITARLTVGAPLLAAGRTRKGLALEAHDAVAALLEVRSRS